jgi:2-keto-4-pentenoate hydratase/2-oxohepta-3-ene-1,7-dioic acid hydratase in catechol pathway
MRIATYADSAGNLRAGFLTGSVLVDAAETIRAAGLELRSADRDRISAKHVLRQAPELRERMAVAAAELGTDHGIALGEVRLVAPVPDPEKIICVGLNYAEHTAEFRADLPRRPVLFSKFCTSLIGSGEAIRLPAISDQVDWEGELAVVIGRECRSVSESEAIDYVAGAMPFNDVTARDLQAETSQWLAGKALDTFAPCGPALVTLDEIGDLQDLELITRVNGEVVQRSSTSKMIFPVAAIVSFISELMTLRPGDIIATGTPEGVGFRRTPPRFLAPGDVVEVEVERAGRLVNHVAAMTASEELPVPSELPVEQTA